MSRTENQIKAFLASEAGKMNAERFIKALKEERILCSVQSVSKSGTVSYTHLTLPTILLV